MVIYRPVCKIQSIDINKSKLFHFYHYTLHADFFFCRILFFIYQVWRSHTDTLCVCVRSSVIKTAYKKLAQSRKPKTKEKLTKSGEFGETQKTESTWRSLQRQNTWIRFSHKNQAYKRKPNTIIRQAKQIKTTTKQARKKKSNSLKIIFTNADQMTSGKISELKLLVLQHKPFVISVIEMKLKERTIELFKITNWRTLLYTIQTE